MLTVVVVFVDAVVVVFVDVVVVIFVDVVVVVVFVDGGAGVVASMLLIFLP